MEPDRWQQIVQNDRTDLILRNRINQIFGYDSKLDSFENKRIIIKYHSFVSYDVMYGLIPFSTNTLKSHPRQRESGLKELGFDMYRDVWINPVFYKHIFCLFIKQ